MFPLYVMYVLYSRALVGRVVDFESDPRRNPVFPECSTSLALVTRQFVPPVWVVVGQRLGVVGHWLGSGVPTETMRGFRNRDGADVVWRRPCAGN
jgi:hypothetical protein